MMKRVNQIWNHPLYQEHYQQIQKFEKNRPFCGHSLAHFLDTARLCYIYNLEQQTNIDRELIYGAALLHDIGRDEQYLEHIPHHIASVRIAEKILPDCDFSPGEIQQITEAIEGHRNREICQEKSLKGFLYLADKSSRSCLSCEACQECDWPQEKKNLQLDY